MPPIFTEHPLQSVLTVSAVIFSCGVFTIITRRNAVSILMGVELVLNAANLNLVAFAQFSEKASMGIHGITFVLFVILLAAAEAAVALAIIIGIYQNFGKIDVDEATMLKQ